MGANIETNAQDAKKDLESLCFEDKEQIVSVEVKVLHTNIPFDEIFKKIFERSLLKHSSSSNLKDCNENRMKASDDKYSF